MWEQLLMWYKQFRNICLCKLHYFFPSYIYPPEILPKANFKVPINIEELNQIGNYVIIRRSNKPKDISFDSLGMLREDALVTKPSELPNLSMNILGGSFNIKHINYRPQKDAIKNWEEKESVFLLDYLTQWEYLKETTPIFFFLKDIHTIQFPYERDYSDKETRKLIQAFDFLKNEDKAIFKGKTVVTHEPIKLNYWHVELKLKDVEGKIVKKADSTWKKSAAESALNDILLVKAYPNIKEINSIPKEFFC